MKYFKLIVGLILSSIIGLLFAGIYGALAIGLILALTISIIKVRFQLTTLIYTTIIFSVLSYLLMIGLGLLNAKESVHNKVNAIKIELKEQGYSPKWIIISQKRYKLYNSLLVNSLKNGKSKHLKGEAIDLYIYDINADGRYDMNDFEIFKKASHKIEKVNKKMKGGVYHYLGKGFFSRRMIHVELNK